jgi:hypothetical protein
VILLQLMGFGIPVNVLPVSDKDSDEGDRKVLKNHEKWLKRRQVKEDTLLKYGHFQGIDLPGKLIQ